MGLSLRSAHSSNPVLDTEKLRMDGEKETHCRSLENWLCWAVGGMLHLLQGKGDERSMCWRVKGARARICLVSGDYFPSSRALCPYAV